MAPTIVGAAPEARYGLGVLNLNVDRWSSCLEL